MKKLTRSATDRKLAGVCAGIAAYFGIDPTLIRIGWVVFCLMGGSGVLAGLLTIVLGSLLSWIGSFFTYGFGQLIENTDDIRSKMKGLN